MGKPNCWEQTQCGRQAGGQDVDSLGVCPASTEKRLDGVHGGENAGRSCWAVAYTLCEGKSQGDVDSKRAMCAACEFHHCVMTDESPNYLYLTQILRMLEKEKKAG